MFPTLAAFLKSGHKLKNDIPIRIKGLAKQNAASPKGIKLKMRIIDRAMSDVNWQGAIKQQCVKKSGLGVYVQLLQVKEHLKVT